MAVFVQKNDQKHKQSKWFGQYWDKANDIHGYIEIKDTGVYEIVEMTIKNNLDITNDDVKT